MARALVSHFFVRMVKKDGWAGVSFNVYVLFRCALDIVSGILLRLFKPYLVSGSISFI